MRERKLVYNPQKRHWGYWVTYRGKRIFIPAKKSESKIASAAKILGATVAGAGIGAGVVLWAIQRRISQLPSPIRQLMTRYFLSKSKLLKLSLSIPKGLRIPKEHLKNVRLLNASVKWKELFGAFPILPKLKAVPLIWKDRLYLFYRDVKAVPREIGRFVWRKLTPAERGRFLPLIQKIMSKLPRRLKGHKKRIVDAEEIFADAYARTFGGTTSGIEYKKDIFEKLADLIKKEFKVEVSWSAD